MAAVAKDEDLLYVSDTGKATVRVYSWPRLKHRGTLTGFEGPEGICVDKAQDVYIVDYDAQDIFEYAHGGTTPIRTLSETFGAGIGCSIDPQTGNLAVTDYQSPTNGPGNVLIYGRASGTPTQYAVSNVTYPFLPAYDEHGNLFVDGDTADGPVALAELPKGGAAFEPIGLSQSISYAGGFQWDGVHLAVGDQTNDVIYQFAISGSQAKEVGQTALGGAAHVFDFFITAKDKREKSAAVVGADINGNRVLSWRYPAGGAPVKTIGAGLTFPQGVAISRHI
jgi:hypothetical protein